MRKLKIIGWSDPALSARSTIEYFKAVQRRTPESELRPQRIQ